MQIREYQNLRDEVQKTVDHADIDVWLRIRLKGFKFGLLNEINNWSLLFKNHLRDTVINSLQVSLVWRNGILEITTLWFIINKFNQELDEFVEEAMTLLAKEIDKDNLNDLLNAINWLTKIEERQFETDNMFDPLKDIMVMLKEYKYVFDPKIYTQVRKRELILFYK